MGPGLVEFEKAGDTMVFGSFLLAFGVGCFLIMQDKGLEI